MTNEPPSTPQEPAADELPLGTPPAFARMHTIIRRVCYVLLFALVIEGALTFPLLSDVHRNVIRAYEVWDEDRNVAFRSTAIVDVDGKLRWSQSGDRLMTRNGSEIRRVVELIRKLRTGS